MGLRTGISHGISLAIQTTNEHRAAMLFAAGLAGRKSRGFLSLWQNIPKPLAEAAAAEFLRAAEKFDRVIRAERCDEEFHGAEMTIAKR